MQHLDNTPTLPSRVVLLGARGFLATALQAELARQGAAVTALGAAALDLREADSEAGLVSELRSDDTLVMLSALTPDRGRGLDIAMANLRMAQHVCGALTQAACRHVVYISSDAVYRDNLAFVDEDSAADSTSVYGAMHGFRERMLWQTLAGKATRLAILRPTLIFGSGDTHNSYGPNRFMRAIVKDRKITMFGAGEEQRDHVFVDDAARLIVEVIRRQSAGTLNVATGESIGYGELAERIAALSAEPVQIEQLARPAGAVILHRHYDVTRLRRSFPDFVFTPRIEALQRAWTGYAAGA